MLVNIHTLLEEYLTGITLPMARRDQRWRTWPHTFVTSGRNLKSALFNPDHVEQFIIQQNGVNYAEILSGNQIGIQNTARGQTQGRRAKAPDAPGKRNCPDLDEFDDPHNLLEGIR